jgi:hypothetical protein
MTDVRPDLNLDPETAFFILMKAREIDAKVEESDPDSGSNPSDDKGVDVLESRPSDPDYLELSSAVQGLNDDQQLDLLALIWIGRGDFELSQWNEAREAARDIGRGRTPRYVAGIPLASDYLQEALSQLGLSLEDWLEEH